jgi:UDP-glucuronate 4-epimerase
MFSMRNKTILITGSAGFIGFHVAMRFLQSGYKVLGIDNLNDYYDPLLKNARIDLLKKFNTFSFHHTDIRDSEAIGAIVNNARIESICHLAAQAGVRYSILEPERYVRSNIEGFITILEVAKKNGIKNIIYASSSSVYGNNQMPKTGFSEQDVINQPISIYGVTKRSNELTAYTYHHLFGMNVTGLRFFTVYGPYGRPDMAYFSFTKQILEGVPIHVFNKGKMRRDFTYIDDIVDGVVSAVDKSYSYEIFNLGNSHTVTLMDFIHCIEKETGRKAIINFEPQQPGDVLETFANIAHAREKLGFNPKTTIEKGMHEFISWYKAYSKIT